MEEDLSALLSAGEQGTFHGSPMAAVPTLRSAVALAEEQGRAAERATASWLLGVALAAIGRYAEALPLLTPLVEWARSPEATETCRDTGAHAAAAIGDVHRRLGRHAVAREHDRRGLAVAVNEDAVVECRLGLAADAVGLEEADVAETELTAAASALRDSPADAPLDMPSPAVSTGQELWRQRVRLDWGRTELALLRHQHEWALETAMAAVTLAEARAAPRHVAQGLIFLGAVQVRRDDDEAVATLTRAAVLAESLGTLPLVWRSRALLGALLAGSDRSASEECLVAAQTAARALADDLPPGVRAEWMARPDVTALFQDSRHEPGRQ